MAITLFCLVKGNKSANAFSVKISKDEPISELKEAIKTKKPQTFANVDANDIKLWKLNISDDLSLEDGDELLAINDIGDYWPTSPPKKHIHVLVSPPETTAISSREQKLLDQVASLQALLNKSTHAFDVVVRPKQKANKWTVNIEQGTLNDLKDYIRELYNPPALENDGAVLNFVNDRDRYYPRNDGSFREMLRSLVSKNNLKFTVIIETPSKAFSDWSFPKVCQLYGLSDDPNPNIDVYPVFKCGCVDTKDERYVEALRKLFDELETRVATTHIDVSYEATKSIYSYSFLASATFPFKSQIKIVPEKMVEGKNGRGKLDFGIESRTTGRTVGLIEVKKDDFKQGLAQATVQMESSLGHKRKANEIDDECGLDKVWGIVTDAEKWYFMECMQDSEGIISFKLSKPLFVAYDGEGTKGMAEKVLGHILWLLEEAQKPVKALEESREIKRVRSVELPKVTDLEGKAN